MPKTKIRSNKMGRSATSGKYIIELGDKSHDGSEVWHITDRDSGVSLSTSSTATSTHVLDGITRKHSKVLKKLAKD